MLSSAAFAPRAALESFWRNKGLSMFSSSVMAVVLMMAGVSLVLAHSFDSAISNLKAKASTISIFIKDSTSLVNVQNMEEHFRNDIRVRSVVYISKANALSRYKNDPSIPPDMIDSLEGYNPLPASLDVDVKNVADLDAIASDVKASPLLDEHQPTNYRKEVIDKVVLFSRFVAVAGFALLLGLAGVSVFIIMMSIRTAIFVRRKEIEVMKLVGATDWFVRGPFLLEGMFAGVIAAVLSVLVVVGGYGLFVNKVRAAVPFLPLAYDPQFTGQLVLILVFGGVLLGAFGSYLGVRRFLLA
jgi:cell division transport system permease protein